MTILNEPSSDGGIEVLSAICKFLMNFPKTKKNDIKDIFQEGSNEKEKKISPLVNSTIGRWIELGMFSEENDYLYFSKEICSYYPQPSQDDISRMIRFIIFKPENNPIANYWQTGSETGLLAGDFSKGAAWLLAQDILTLPQKSFADLEPIAIDQLKIGDARLIRQRDRFIPLIKYMMYLGFCEPDPFNRSDLIEREHENFNLDQSRRDIPFMIDPTKAIGEELDKIFGSDESMSADGFVKGLGKAIPILDGGIYRLEVESKLDPQSWKGPNEKILSKSLSKALDRLEKKNLISLIRGSDTRPWSTDAFGKKEFSVVMRVQK